MVTPDFSSMLTVPSDEVLLLLGQVSPDFAWVSALPAQQNKHSEPCIHVAVGRASVIIWQKELLSMAKEAVWRWFVLAGVASGAFHERREHSHLNPHHAQVGHVRTR